MKSFSKLKNDQSGVVHHLMMIVIVVVVMGAIGFAGWRVYQNKNGVDAKAASYYTLSSWQGASVTSCRVAKTNSVKYLLVNKARNGSSMQFSYSMYDPSSKNPVSNLETVRNGATSVRYLTGKSASYRPNGGIMSGGRWLSQGWISKSISSLPKC